MDFKRRIKNLEKAYDKDFNDLRELTDEQLDECIRLYREGKPCPYNISTGPSSRYSHLTDEQLEEQIAYLEKKLGYNTGGDGTSRSPNGTK